MLCPVCDGKSGIEFLPVFWCSVILFIDWLTTTAKLLFAINNKQQILSLLMSSTFWKEMIFDKALSSASLSNVDVLFLQLAAAGIVEIKYNNNTFVWVVGQQPLAVHKQHVHVTLIEATLVDAKYNIDINWEGICQHLETRIRVCNLHISVGSCLD
jgi:hypothetical protein